MEFAASWAFYGLLAVIPIIILYLLKPKPKFHEIPSVMFFWKVQQTEKLRSFFKKIFRDPLLFLQLLIILILVLAMANPIIEQMERETKKENLAVIIDVSASMQANTPTKRFDEALSIAKNIAENAGSEDSIELILAANIPIVAGSELNKEVAIGILNTIQLRDTETNLVGAMNLARDLLASKGSGAIYVISDFSSISVEDPILTAQKISVSDVTVQLIKVGNSADNIGFVSAYLEKGNDCVVHYTILNTGEKRTLTVTAQSDLEKTTDQILAATGQNSGKITVKCRDEKTKLVVSFDSSDALVVDDYLYLILPTNQKKDILFIGTDEYVFYVLQSLPGVSVLSDTPPTLPDFKGFDVIVLGSFDGQMLPGTFNDLENFVNSGGNLIILASNSLPEFDEEDIIPIGITGMIKGDISQSDHPVIQGIDFGLTQSFDVKEKEGTTTIATILNKPFIVYKKYGAGTSIYIGLLNSTFHLQPSYPIFWTQLIEWLYSSEKNDYFYKSGELFSNFEDSEGVTVAENLLLEKTGFYEVGNSEIAINLLSETESDINMTQNIDEFVSEKPGMETSVLRKYDYMWLLALVCVLLILFEWRYYRSRGQL